MYDMLQKYVHAVETEGRIFLVVSDDEKDHILDTHKAIGNFLSQMI